MTVLLLQMSDAKCNNLNNTRWEMLVGNMNSLRGWIRKMFEIRFI